MYNALIFANGMHQTTIANATVKLASLGHAYLICGCFIRSLGTHVPVVMRSKYALHCMH